MCTLLSFKALSDTGSLRELPKNGTCTFLQILSHLHSQEIAMYATPYKFSLLTINHKINYGKYSRTFGCFIKYSQDNFQFPCKGITECFVTKSKQIKVTKQTDCQVFTSVCTVAIIGEMQEKNQIFFFSR